MKDDLEAQLIQAIRDKDEAEQNMRGRLQDLNAALESERKKSAHYKSELAFLKASSSEEITKLQIQLKALQAENERTKKMHIEGSKRDHEALDRERIKNKTEKESYIADTKRQYEGQISELRLRLESKDALLINTEQELNEARRHLTTKTETASRDFEALQDTLMSTRKVLAIQEQDFERMKADRNEALREVRLLSKETAVIENERALQKKEIQELKAQNKRLQKIVYGRSPRKSTGRA